MTDGTQKNGSAADRDAMLTALRASLDEINISVDAQAFDKFALYYERLIEWNQKMNLTALTDPVDVAQKHFADSLLPLCYELIPQGSHVIDVGTGAGFPGVVLAIIRPDIRMTLLDSLQKRLNFLRAVCDELGVTAEFVHARAEDGGRDPILRGKFDRALSRAVAPASVLVELVMPFVKCGGFAICYKGADSQKEFLDAAPALKKLHASQKELLEMNCSWGKRTLVMIQQNQPMPAKYPRKAGTPSKEPLA